MKEIFNLVDHGFSYSDLISMGVAQRRYYFHLMLERAESQKNPNGEGRSPKKQ